MTNEPLIRAVVDARSLNTPHVRGIGKYLLEMLDHFPRELPFKWILCGDRPECGIHTPSGQCSTDVFEFKGYRFHTWEQLGMPLRARKHRADMLFCPANTAPAVQLAPCVLTIHDTMPWRTADESDQFSRLYWNRVIESAIKKCQAVITISEASRDDILDRWPALASKLHVIPHGINDRYLVNDALRANADTLQRLSLRDRYVLYMGGAAPRKRFNWAVNVFLSATPVGLRLKACGFTAEEAHSAFELLPHEAKERVDFRSYVPEADMPTLYAHADAVLYPTEYEGFGFPAIEAQATGTTILLSPVASLRELIGPAAIALPPQDMSEWVAALRSITTSPQRDRRPDCASREWAYKFRWVNSAVKHAEVMLKARG